MSKLKSFDEFVNENLVTKGTYNFYGPGSLNPIVKKLIGEGKNKSIIATYLTSLGVEAWRIEKAFEELSEIEIAIVSKHEVNEKNALPIEKESKERLTNKKAKFEDVANNFLGKLEEDSEEATNEAKKKTFEDAAAAFILGLTGSDAINDDKDPKIEEKLNKKTLQVEGEGEDIDDMIDDLEDGDEDEDQGPDDNAPDGEGSPEQKIKDGESPADAVEGDAKSATDKIANAAEELAKDSKKLEKIKKLLGETKEVELEDDGKEVEDKEDIEDEETGDDIQVEESINSDNYMKAVTEGFKHRFRK